MKHKVQANASGTRSIEVSDEHLQTLRRYRLLDQLVGSNGVIDETVVDKLKFTVRSLLGGAFGHDKALLDLCLDVIYNKHMKAIGLTHLMALYDTWKVEQDGEAAVADGDSVQAADGDGVQQADVKPEEG